MKTPRERTKKDFLGIHDLSRYEFYELLDLAQEIKARPQDFRKALKDLVLAMIFEKPSLRTRMTFEVGMHELGGRGIYLSPSEIQLGQRETVEDVGHNLERWVDGIMIRTFAHDTLLRLARAASIPVINALTDLLHPCQAMADFFTLKEHKGDLGGIRLAWTGDGNNVCHSLMFAAAKAGATISVATPEGYAPNPEIVRLALEDGRETGFKLELGHDPAAAARGADAIYADVWTSMGQEAEKAERLRIFAPFQVNDALLALAKPDAVFMHCLPAHRGEEVSASVLDGPRSIVFDQAENRLHVQKAIMLVLMGKRRRHG
jgi:ornithine carbamoyltransferase